MNGFVSWRRMRSFAASACWRNGYNDYSYPSPRQSRGKELHLDVFRVARVSSSAPSRLSRPNTIASSRGFLNAGMHRGPVLRGTAGGGKFRSGIRAGGRLARTGRGFSRPSVLSDFGPSPAIVKFHRAIPATRPARGAFRFGFNSRNYPFFS